MQSSDSCACSCLLTAASQQAQRQDLQESMSCDTAAYHPQICLLTLVPGLCNCRHISTLGTILQCIPLGTEICLQSALIRLKSAFCMP